MVLIAFSCRAAFEKEKKNLLCLTAAYIYMNRASKIKDVIVNIVTTGKVGINDPYNWFLLPIAKLHFKWYVSEWVFVSSENILLSSKNYDSEFNMFYSYDIQRKSFQDLIYLSKRKINYLISVILIIMSASIDFKNEFVSSRCPTTKKKLSFNYYYISFQSFQ